MWLLLPTSGGPMADTPSNAYYRNLVERLLMVDSVDAIRTAVRAAPRLDASDLFGAFDAVERDRATRHDEPELDLVRFVREVVEGLLATGRPQQALDPASPEAAVRRAREAGGVFAAYQALRHHAGKLRFEHFDALQSEYFRRPPWQTSRQPDHDLHALCALAVVLHDDRALARALAFRGARCRERGRLQAAARCFMRSERLANASGDSETAMMASVATASLAEHLGDWDAAVASLTTMLKRVEAEQQAEAASSIRRKLAGILRSVGRYSEALELLDAEVAWIDTPDTSHLADVAARVRLNRGLVLEDIGRYEQGEAEFERARDLARRCGARDLEFQALNNRAASALKRRDTRTALTRFLEVRRTVETWASPSAVAAAHNNLGQAYLDAGHAGEALKEFRAALRLKTELGERFGEAIACTGMGDALNRLGDVKAAEACWNIALVPCLETGNLTTLTVVAQRLADAGRFDPELAEIVKDARARAVSEGELALEVPLTESLASAAIQRGDEEAALALYRDSLSRVQRSLERSPSGIALEAHLGVLEARRPESRLVGYQRLEAVVATVEVRLAATRLDERRSEIIGTFLDVYAAVIDLLVAHGADLPVDDPIAEAFRLHETAKGRSFVASLADAEVTVSEGVPEALRQREHELLALERNLQAHHVRSSESSAGFRQRRLAELHDQLEACWTEMEPVASDYVRLRRGEPVDHAEVRRTLTAASAEPMALVSFFCGADTTTAFVIRTDDDDLHTYSANVGRGRIAEAAQALRRAFNGDPTAFPPYPPIRRGRPDRRSLAPFEELSHELLAFLPALDGLELVMVAPHGPLHLLPLHALHMPDGAFLGDRHALVYAPSATALAYCLRRRSHSDPRARPSVYVAATAAGEDAHPHFFETDGGMFDPSKWAVGSELAGETSPRGAIRGLEAHDVAHITCHGYFDDQRPLQSGLLLGNGEQRPPRDIRSVPIIERSNYLLTARELLRSRISAGLVTVRACSTGMQAERNTGDELDGLTRSLLYAGSSSVIVSLWNVDQESSRDLVRGFYDRWQSDPARGKWRALWDAQRALRSDPERPHLQHPYHWAPLVLVGDWR
jgi:tetratricopeptide (TPR) repeat protein